MLLLSALSSLSLLWPATPVQTATHGRANKFLNNHNSWFYGRNGARWPTAALLASTIRSNCSEQLVCFIPLLYSIGRGLRSADQPVDDRIVDPPASHTSVPFSSSSVAKLVIRRYLRPICKAKINARSVAPNHFNQRFTATVPLDYLNKPRRSSVS